MDLEFYEQGSESHFVGMWWCPALTSEFGSVFRISSISLAVKSITTTNPLKCRIYARGVVIFETYYFMEIFLGLLSSGGQYSNLILRIPSSSSAPLASTYSCNCNLRVKALLAIPL